MASLREQTMQVITERLQNGSPPISAVVRRSHRTAVPRDQCPAIHIADGSDDVRATRGDCRTEREAMADVSIIVRDDDGYGTADDLAETVMARLRPDAEPSMPYPDGVRIDPVSIDVDDEVADLDILRLVLRFRIRYTAGYWSLGAV